MAAREDPTGLPPAGLTWGQYVAQWVDDTGGWLALADALISRAGDAAEIAHDPQTVERGLRRLARRGHKPGGQYGRWMLRFFGFTSPVERWAKWMGQYHTRFADLPCSLRLEQLALWNRPPLSESRLACWLHVGIASAHRSRLDLAAAEHWLRHAERRVDAAGPAAKIEIALFRGRLETDAGDRYSAQRRYEAVGSMLDAADLPLGDTLAYRARLQDQRAYHLTKPLPGAAPDIEGAKALYVSIPEDPTVPFASFRRAVGLAYCEWQLGDPAAAAALASQAADHAGDAGLIRMRIMALNMLTRLSSGADADALNARARGMAALLEDEDLLERVARSAESA